MEERDYVVQVKNRAGLQSRDEAKRALAATVGALGCALEAEDVRALERALPTRFARVLERRGAIAVRNAKDLYAEAARRERVKLGFAIEHVHVALEVLAEQLNPELVALLRGRLPSDIAALLRTRRRLAGSPPHVYRHPAREPLPRQTLSRSRPGAADSIAETRHALAHADSVVRSSAPHAERSVATASSTRPGREDETLATVRLPPPAK